MFTITRIFSDKQGVSHFDVRHIPLKPSGNVGFLSEPFKVDSLIFRQVESSDHWDFYPAPHRQFIILLNGEIQIETSDGDIRTFSAGDILLVEDTTGEGHRTRNLLPMDRKSLFITVSGEIMDFGF